MESNHYILLVAALVPMVIGFIWYHPKVFGTQWMNVAGLTQEKIDQGKMAPMLILSYIFSIFLAVGLSSLCIHQMGVQSLYATQEGFGEAGSAMQLEFEGVMELVKGRHRSFGHGVFHGVLAGIMFAFAILATNSLFERKGWKYIWINSGYWILTMALMGGIICKFM